MEIFTPISTTTGYGILILYAAIMLILVGFFATKNSMSLDNYLIANRKLSVFRGAASLAVSWIWAPAIFFCAVKAYLQGLPGAFWFIFPNIICFFTFALVIRKMRKINPNIYSLPDFITKRFDNHKYAHIASLIVIAVIDVVALLFNAFIGAFLLNLLAGIPVAYGILAMMGVALSYSIWKGLPASVVTDVVQLALIVVIAIFLIPWATFEAGGFSTILSGMGGKSGEFSNLFNWDVFYSFGIPSSLALITVPIADQMFYQRAVSIPKKSLMRTFSLAGVLFGVVPLILCVFGFIAASPEFSAILGDKAFPIILVNVEVVQHYLPQWALIGFAVMALCALSSTLDSALCALGSIWGKDIYQRYILKSNDEKDILKSIRMFTLLIGAIVAILAILLRNQLNGDVLFNFNGIVASTIVFPVLLTLFWKRITPVGVAVGVILSLLVFVPIGWHVNVAYHVAGKQEYLDYLVAVSIGTPIFSLLVTTITSLLTKTSALQQG